MFCFVFFPYLFPAFADNLPFGIHPETTALVSRLKVLPLLQKSDKHAGVRTVPPVSSG